MDLNKQIGTIGTIMHGSGVVQMVMEFVKVSLPCQMKSIRDRMKIGRLEVDCAAAEK